MEESLRKVVRPKFINLASSSATTSNNEMTTGPSARKSQMGKQSGISPVQAIYTAKSSITPSLSEQKRRQVSLQSSRTIIKDPLPQKVMALDSFSVQKVVCGSDQTFVITAPSEREASHCFSWGCNSHAQLGHSHELHHRSTSATESQQYGTSSNKMAMQKVQSPTLIDGLEGANITDISCGNSHAFAWSSQEQVVYGWGNGANGRLGNEDEDIVQTPKVLECFREGTQMGLFQIRAISCGENHTLALVDVDIGQIDESEQQQPSQNITGNQEERSSQQEQHHSSQEQQNGVTRLFVWGCNEKKQLGLQSDQLDDANTDEVLSNGARSGPNSSTAGTFQISRFQKESKVCKDLRDRREQLEMYTFSGTSDVKVPHQLDPCPFESHEDGQVPLQVQSGYNYSGAVTTDGVIYTWGFGSFGRLGYIDVLKQPVPRQMVELKGHTITKLSLGYYHAAAIDDHGVVYSWGRGNHGQLGRGNVLNEDCVKPVNALANNRIIDVHCGESHSVVLSAKGEVYAWGGGSMGQLGLGDCLRQSLPIKVSHFETKVIQISCGKRHSAALTEDKHLYTWGSNEYGQLGRQGVKLYLKKQNVSTSGTSTGQHIAGSAKTSPSMNLIQTTYQFYNQHKIPLSTDNQATMNRFEFPQGNSGTSEDDESTNFNRLNRMAESVNLSQSLSPHQNFTPINKLQDQISSPYNQKEKLPRNEQNKFPPKLELDSNSDSANQYYKHFGQQPQTSQGYMPTRQFLPSQLPQPQSATHQHNSTMFGMYPHDSQLVHHPHQRVSGQFSGPNTQHEGQMTPMTPGQISYQRQMQLDQTPKYIRDLKGELNVALKKNLELSNKLERKEEELESDIQNQVIGIGEKSSQQIKKSEKTSQIDHAINSAFEALDSLTGQQNLIRFVKSNLESTGSLRKEVILQNALIHSLESQASLQQMNVRRSD